MKKFVSGMAVHANFKGGDELYAGTIRKVRKDCRATIGELSNEQYVLKFVKWRDGCALEVVPYDLTDVWHPSRFEDARSTHVNAVRRVPNAFGIFFF